VGEFVHHEHKEVKDEERDDQNRDEDDYPGVPGSAWQPIKCI
jgi:hypothetical protein